MKKVVIYTTIGVALVVLGVYASSSVYAQDTSPLSRIPFISELAEKLDMPEEELENVVEEVRDAHRAEMDAERAEAVLQAMEDGKLTERQAEILNSIEDLRPEQGQGMFGMDKDLTQEEREALREKRRANREGTMVDALNEKGLNVTEEEMQELRDLREELGLMGMGRRGGQGGMGFLGH